MPSFVPDNENFYQYFKIFAEKYFLYTSLPGSYDNTLFFNKKLNSDIKSIKLLKQFFEILEYLRFKFSQNDMFFYNSLFYGLLVLECTESSFISYKNDLQDIFKFSVNINHPDSQDCLRDLYNFLQNNSTFLLACVDHADYVNLQELLFRIDKHLFVPKTPKILPTEPNLNEELIEIIQNAFVC